MFLMLGAYYYLSELSHCKIITGKEGWQYVCVEGGGGGEGQGGCENKRGTAAPLKNVPINR